MSRVAVKGFHPKKWYDNIPRKTAHVLPTLGTVLLLISFLMLPSVLSACLNNENIHMFIWQTIVGILLGLFIKFRYAYPKAMCPADGLVMIFCMWFMMFFFGMIPYLISGMDIIDAFFESVSGFSTTGASIISDVTVLPKSLLLWRVMTNWIGGLIIVTIFMFIMPMVVSGGRSILNNEMSGASSGNLSVRLANAGRQFLGVYTVLTIVFAVVYILLGLPVRDGLCLAMSVISIGGFVNVNNSLASYDVGVLIATAVFLMISASNFYLHFRLVMKREFGYTRNEEFKTMIIWFTIVVVYLIIQSMSIGGWDIYQGGAFEKICMITFSVVSFGTTAGFTAIDIMSYWSYMGATVFLVLMFIGGSAGSTAGGVKISRAIIVFKAMINEIRQVVHPNAVYRVRYEGHGVPMSTVHNAMVIIIVFILVVVISSIVFCTLYPPDESMFLSVALITNTGTTIGSNASDYSRMPAWAKLFSCLLMFLGRMEVLTILAMLTPALWKEFFGPRKIEAFKDTLFARKYRGNSKDRRKGRKGSKNGKDESAEDVSSVPETPIQ